jgi:hypothetical protein
VPNTNPGEVIPPSSDTNPSASSVGSSSSEPVQAGEFGVRIMTLATPSTAQTSTTFSSDTAINAGSLTPAPSSAPQNFQVQPMNLEPPSSVLPSALNSLNALDVISPSSASVPGLPGLGDVGSVLPPSAVAPPSVGSTPADHPGTVQAPSSVTGGLPTSVTTGAAPDRVIPPGGVGTDAKLFDANDDNFKRYLEWKDKFEKYAATLIGSLMRKGDLTEEKLSDALRGIANFMSQWLVEYTRKYNPAQLEMVRTTIANVRADFSDPLEQVMFLFDYSAAVHMAPSFGGARNMIVNMYAASKVLHAVKHGTEQSGYDEIQRLNRELRDNPNFNSTALDKLTKYGRGHLTPAGVKRAMLEQASYELFTDYKNVKEERARFWEETFANAKAGLEIALLIAQLAVIAVGAIEFALVFAPGAIYVLGNVGPRILAQIQQIINRWSGAQTRTIGIVAPGFSSSSNGGITVQQAEATALRNGIDTRQFTLRYAVNPMPNTYGSTPAKFTDKTFSVATPMRTSSGRFIIELTPMGLRDERTSLATIAHELNHIRGYLANGIASSEEAAEAAAQLALKYFR